MFLHKIHTYFFNLKLNLYKKIIVLKVEIRIENMKICDFKYQQKFEIILHLLVELQ
jgi:hypothetical protein